LFEQGQISKEIYQKQIGGARPIVTEIEHVKNFYYAEADHQQYKAKPFSRNYYGLDPLGVNMPKDWKSGGSLDQK
jgi:peptide methionine sulfoxide reductase MsrA